MQNVRTPLDHMYVNVSLAILEMDKIAQVNLINFILGRAWEISFSSLSLFMYYDVYMADRLLIASYSSLRPIFDA